MDGRGRGPVSRAAAERQVRELRAQVDSMRQMQLDQLRSERSEGRSVALLPPG